MELALLSCTQAGGLGPGVAHEDTRVALIDVSNIHSGPQTSLRSSSGHFCISPCFTLSPCVLPSPSPVIQVSQEAPPARVKGEEGPRELGEPMRVSTLPSLLGFWAPLRAWVYATSNGGATVQAAGVVLVIFK